MAMKPPPSRITHAKTFGAGKLSVGASGPPPTRAVRIMSAKGSRTS